MQKALSSSKPQAQPENKAKESSFADIPKKESSDHEKYMPAYTPKEESVVSAVPKEEPVTPVTQEEKPVIPVIPKKEPVVPVVPKEEPVIPVIQREEVITPPEPQPERQIVEPVRTQPVVKEEKRDFEKFIGENLLSKIGITTLVLGIAYFVKYAIDQNWINEIGRVAIGIFVGGVVIAIAHKLKNSYRAFSSILVGGGISVLYITVSIAFHDYQIFSQAVSFVLLILITIFSVFLAILYDRKELAIFSLLGGFASPLLVSTGVGNYIVLFSYILILNTGMLILAFKKQWRVVGMIAYILTQLSFWGWLVFSFYDEKHPAVAGATCFIFLFFVQFYLLALIDHYKSERKITPLQIFIILSNNLSLFASTIYIFNDNPVNVKGLITVIIAVLNAIPMIILFKGKKADKQLIYLLIAVVLTFISLAVPVQLNGCAITMFWAVETVILLWLWQKSEINIFKYGFVAIQLLVIVSLLMDWSHFYIREMQPLPIIFNKPFITGMVITATVWINAFLLRKEAGKEFLPELTFPSRWFSFAGIILLFFTLFWELQYQMNQYYEPQSFRLMIYGLYCYTFIGVLTVIRWNKDNWKDLIYGFLIAASALYIIPYGIIVYKVRGEIISGDLSHWGYFAMHYLTLPSIVLFFVFLLKNKKESLNKEAQQFIYWFIAVISVIILSCETDHVILMSFFNGANKYELLKISHNIIYPVLWGIASFILMVTGMKQKNRTLRIISLSLFALIIAKLYLYDVWKMEQAGRIIAFIFLGVILLSVSFLYQKLKTLLMKDEEKQKEELEIKN
jgi:uncharacterized membrane protein